MQFTYGLKPIAFLLCRTKNCHIKESMEKPKILFVVPPFSEHGHDRGKIHVVRGKRELRVYPTLGVCYLISGLESNKKLDYDVELIDAPAENLTLDSLIRKIIMAKPTIIALTVTTFTLYISHQIVVACKKTIPSAKIILGGIHITHSPNDFRYFDADYALRGDCEFTIKQLVEAILQKKDVRGIRGIIYKENGNVIVTEPAVIDDLDSINFPDRTRLDPQKYIFPLFNKKFTTIIGSRGCPYKCIYCGLPYNRKYKTRSVANIIQEMKIIQSHGYEYVSFSDDIFTLDRKRGVELCNQIKNNFNALKWGCATRADCVDYDLFKIMKDAGCLDVRFGVESGNEHIRKEIIHKDISNEQYIKAINAAKKSGLITIGFFLFGYPTETFENMKETIIFAKKLNLDYAYFGITVPIPNSEIYVRALKEKKIDKNIWRDVIYRKKEIPFYCPDGVSLEDMRGLMTKANRSFYLRPMYLFMKLKSIESIEELFFKIKMGLNFLLNRG